MGQSGNEIAFHFKYKNKITKNVSSLVMNTNYRFEIAEVAYPSKRKTTS
jgi:hypothetical protein